MICYVVFAFSSVELNASQLYHSVMRVLRYCLWPLIVVLASCWMQYLDEQGNWHAVDLMYSRSDKLNDPRYVGFVHGAEDHPWFAELDNRNLLSGQPVQLENGDLVLFHYHPIFRGARYGFKLVDSIDMEYYSIEKTIVVRTRGNSVAIELGYVDGEAIKRYLESGR